MISLKWSNYIKNQLSVSPYWRKHNYVKLKISFLPFWIKKLSSLPFKVLIINEIILFLSDYFSYFFELFSIPVGIADLPVQFSTHFLLNKCEVLSTNLWKLEFRSFCVWSSLRTKETERNQNKCRNIPVCCVFQSALEAEMRRPEDSQ